MPLPRITYQTNLSLENAGADELAELAGIFDRLSRHEARLKPHFRDHVRQAVGELAGKVQTFEASAAAANRVHEHPARDEP